MQKIFLGCFYCGIITLLTTCGISNITPLNSAIVTYNRTNGWVKIEHNTGQNPNAFKGYNIYYKLYVPGDTLSQNADRDYLTDVKRAPNESLLTTRNFSPIYRFSPSDNSKLPIQKTHISPDIKNISKQHTVYIDISATKSTYIPLRAGGTENESRNILKNNQYQYDGKNNALLIEYNNAIQKVEFLKRDTTDNKGFFGTEEYKATDSDIKKMLGKKKLPEEELEIVFAIISYGIDFSITAITYGPIALTQPLDLNYKRSP